MYVSDSKSSLKKLIFFHVKFQVIKTQVHISQIEHRYSCATRFKLIVTSQCFSLFPVHTAFDISLYQQEILCCRGSDVSLRFL